MTICSRESARVREMNDSLLVLDGKGSTVRVCPNRVIHYAKVGDTLFSGGSFFLNLSYSEY